MTIANLNTTKIKSSDIASKMNEVISSTNATLNYISISSKNMVVDEPWWGSGVSDITYSSGISVGVTRKIWPGDNSDLCANNNLGIFMYRNITFNNTVNLNGDFAIFLATESITVNGELQSIRNPFGTAIPAYKHAQGRSPGHSLHINDPVYNSANGAVCVSCSTGGGGGGGSGDGHGYGGFWGDHLMHPSAGSSLLAGGSGGIGGANSAGTNGSNAPESGSNWSFKYGFHGGAQLSTISPSGFGFNMPWLDSHNPTYNSLPGRQSFSLGDKIVKAPYVDIPIIPGGNGGPGGTSGDYGPVYAGGGGLGGGVIYLIAPKIVINPGGIVRSNGRAGQTHSSPNHFASGAGGGGGGGMIVFICKQGSGSMLHNASIDSDPNAAWSAANWYSADGGAGGASAGRWGPTLGGSGGGGSQLIRVIQSDNRVRIAH